MRVKCWMYLGPTAGRSWTSRWIFQELFLNVFAMTQSQISCHGAAPTQSQQIPSPSAAYSNQLIINTLNRNKPYFVSQSKHAFYAGLVLIGS